jgi:hypothetical protein
MSQHLQALAVANQVRLKRYELKRQIKADEVSVADLLRAEVPSCLERMPVADIVLAHHRFPSQKFRRIMSAADANEGRFLGELTERQRHLIAKGVGEWEKARGIGKAVRA